MDAAYKRKTVNLLRPISLLEPLDGPSSSVWHNSSLTKVIQRRPKGNKIVYLDPLLPPSCALGFGRGAFMLT